MLWSYKKCQKIGVERGLGRVMTKTFYDVNEFKRISFRLSIIQLKKKEFLYSKVKTQLK